MTFPTTAVFKTAPQVVPGNFWLISTVFPPFPEHWTVGTGSCLDAGVVFDASALACVLLPTGATAAAWESCWELCGTAPGMYPSATSWGLSGHWWHPAAAPGTKRETPANVINKEIVDFDYFLPHQILLKGCNAKHGFYFFKYVYSFSTRRNQTQIKVRRWPGTPWPGCSAPSSHPSP